MPINKNHSSNKAILALVWFMVAWMMVFSMSAHAQMNRKPVITNDLGPVEHLGETIPLDFTFQNEAGETVALQSFFKDGRPVIVVMAYYECPMLCTVVLNSTRDVISKMELNLGTDYQVVVVSINPEETSELASKKKAGYMESLGLAYNPAGWAFLTGSAEQSKALADALGFQYTYQEEFGQYAHSAVLHVLSAEGKISRYLYGMTYDPETTRMALVEASEGKVGTVVDRVLSFCYYYDSNEGEYRLMAYTMMRIAGGLTVVLMGIGLAILWRRELKKRTAFS